ncbi:Uncharacterised protein [uncultured Clostridium sp.]|nr:Uncharacterised protein [uncultured Clostridium sp.]
MEHISPILRRLTTVRDRMREYTPRLEENYESIYYG